MLSKELGEAKKTLSSEKMQFEKNLQLLREEHQKEVDEVKRSQRALVQECTLECRLVQHLPVCLCLIHTIHMTVACTITVPQLKMIYSVAAFSSL